MKDDQCIIYLTERTIRHINFTTSKVKDMLRQLTKDIDLTISVNNSDLDELYGEETAWGDEAELPREIDSVRLLFNYAISPCDSKFSYLNGELEIADGLTKTISKYRYKDLFVMKLEEHFEKDSKDTHIHVLLREWER